VVIDQGVDVVVADPGLVRVGLVVGDGPALGSPAATGRDLAELLHVHVDQLARPVSFVADSGGLRSPDHQPGHRVQHRQVRQLVTGQDPRHRPGRHAELDGDPVPSAPFILTELDHSGLEDG
jgi:hypothetical protein